MALTSPLIQPKPGRDAELEAALGHQLRADADAQERPQLLAHAPLQRLAHAGHRVQSVLAVGEGADARQHHAVGGAHDAGLSVTSIAASASLSRAARSKALAAECRLPEP